MPIISIIIPVYKVEQYLQRCLNSIISQTFTDYECILVDDCSPDNCPLICDDYAKQDTRIKVIHNMQNIGASLSRKKGFENSSCDYIQFIDSDDWIEPDMIQKLYTAAIEADADIAACDFYKNYTSNHSYRYVIQEVDTENYFNNLGFVIWCALWNKLFHRNILSRIEFPRAHQDEDRVIIEQAFYFAKKIIKIPYPLYHYVHNEESISRKKNSSFYSDMSENMSITINFLREKLKDKFKLKEDSINDEVNKFKIAVFKSKEISHKTKIINFYPESKFYRWYILVLLKKAIKIMVPYGLVKLYKTIKSSRMLNKNYTIYEKGLFQASNPENNAL